MPTTHTTRNVGTIVRRRWATCATVRSSTSSSTNAPSVPTVSARCSRSRWDNVRMADDPSDDEEMVVIATCIGVPDGGSLTLPVDEGAEFDTRCGIDR